MINLEKLRADINGLHWAVDHLNAMRWDDAIRALWSIDYKNVLYAAESILPKTTVAWDLTASGRSHAPYESHRVIFEAAEIGGCIEALHGEGFQRVLVTAREVPG